MTTTLPPGPVSLPGVELLYREIEKAPSVEGLRSVGSVIQGLAQGAVSGNAEIKGLVRTISSLNDAIVLRLIALLESGEGIVLPPGAGYLVLGSEGRGEQTLRTDQDNAIVYRDGLSAERLLEVERFAVRLVAAQEEIGVPRCPGNIMASSPQWRHSLGEWKRLVNEWVSAPTPEHVLHFGMVQDLRPLAGDRELGLSLQRHLMTAVWRHPNFFSNMAGHVVRFPAPLTFFRRIRVERRGQHRGELDLKKAGIFPISKGVKLLLLEAGLTGGDTWENLEKLGATGKFNLKDLQMVEQAFTYLVRLRLENQIRELSRGGDPTNYLDPGELGEAELERLRQALKGVRAFLGMFRHHYNLDHGSV